MCNMVAIYGTNRANKRKYEGTNDGIFVLCEAKK